MPRADTLLFMQGIASSIEQARALVMSGNVMVGDRKILKPSEILDDSVEFRIRGKEHPWVGRGGIKLDYAVKTWGIDFKDRIVLDIGASTGGFTDVALNYGAKKVYAVDVGSAQLAWKLRTNPKVIILDKTNAKNLNAEIIKDTINIIVCDASFISLKSVLPPSFSLLSNNSYLVALIKPQFEAGKDEVEDGGLITNPAIHNKVIEDIRTWLNAMDNWQCLDIRESPIQGTYGNKEFLLYARHNKD